MRVENVSVAKDGLRIRGQRLFLIHDPAANQMRDVRTVAKTDWFNSHSKVEIDIESGQSQLEMTDVERVMRLVFLSPDEKLVDAVPDYWTG